MTTVYQIKKIHTLKTIVGIDDDLYRDMLMSFDVQSSKDLTFTEAKIFIEILEEKAIAMQKWVKQPKKYEELNRDNNMATPAQMRMIEGMWREICYCDTNYFAKKSLRKFLKSKFKIDDIKFLTKRKAVKVIQAIKGIKANLKKSAATL